MSITTRISNIASTITSPASITTYIKIPMTLTRSVLPAMIIWPMPSSGLSDVPSKRTITYNYMLRLYLSEINTSLDAQVDAETWRTAIEDTFAPRFMLQYNDSGLKFVIKAILGADRGLLIANYVDGEYLAIFFPLAVTHSKPVTLNLSGV